MKVIYKNSFTYKVEQYIDLLPGSVVLRTELASLGDPRQLSRALKRLVQDQKLTKIGYGVYAKMTKIKGIEEPILQGSGFAMVATEALDKLKVQWRYSQAIQDYNAGRTTQIPVEAVVKLDSRFNRKLSYRSLNLRFE